MPFRGRFRICKRFPIMVILAFSSVIIYSFSKPNTFWKLIRLKRSVQQNVLLRHTTRKPTTYSTGETKSIFLTKFMSFPRNLKIFVYDMPSEFNKDILSCHRKREEKHKCMLLSNEGMGPEFYRNSEISVRDTHQFSLEIIMHQKLLRSQSRTVDPTEADLFYIPAYIGLLCLCHYDRQFTTKIIDDLFRFLKNGSYFYDKKSARHRPHFTVVGKIQREMATYTCPYLQHKSSENIHFLGIEKEASESWESLAVHKKISFTVVPYPSYVHYLQDDFYGFSGQIQPKLQDRDVTIFFAASLRKSHPYRSLLFGQFKQKTDSFYDDYKKRNTNSSLSMIMLVTNECGGRHRKATIPWMQHSVFCLQPPGDSPTRKSFYDSVLSGCIPVLLLTQNLPNNPYPFQRYLDYSRFTINISEAHIGQNGKSIQAILKAISAERVLELQQYLAEISHWFQYSFPFHNKTECETDALQLILKELGDTLFNKSISSC